ncbi:hypothetical protein EV1_040341 [Malus domestica]
MSEVWIFDEHGVVRLITNPTQESFEQKEPLNPSTAIAPGARPRVLVYLPTNQFHRSENSVHLISFPKNFANLKSFQMNDIVVKNRVDAQISLSQLGHHLGNNHETNRIAVPKSSTTQKSKLSTGFPALRVSTSSQSAPASAEASKVMVLPSEMKAWIYGEYGGVDVLKFDTKVVVLELLEDQEREIGEKIKIGVYVMEKKVKCGSDVFSAPMGEILERL